VSHLWADEAGSYNVFCAGNAEEQAKIFWVSLDNVACVRIDLASRHADVWPLAADTPRYGLEHFWFDQVLPGLYDIDGQLALHAGAVDLGGSAIVILGPSGRGKSTLVASLATRQSPALNDDGVFVTCERERFAVSPFYKGLRLLPETLAHFFGPETETAPVSSYATKRRVMRQDILTEGPIQIGALIFLGEPRQSSAIDVRRMTATEACMGLVSQSFALDPTDRKRAAARLERASKLASKVPAFALSYPRDFSRLVDVHATIKALLIDHAGAQTAIDCSPLAPHLTSTDERSADLDIRAV